MAWRARAGRLRPFPRPPNLDYLARARRPRSTPHSGVMGTGQGCVFCGRKPLTKQHIFPNWMRKHLPDPGPGTYRRKTGVEPRESAYRGSPVASQVRVVCASCNNGWMERLETDARPYLTSMVVGNGREFHDTGRTLIAGWAFLTTLMIGTTLRVKPPPPEYYTRFYEDEERSLPEGAVVWFGASATGLMHYQQMRCVTYDLDDQTQSDGWMTMLSVGRMAVHAVWLHVGERATLQVRGRLAEALRQVWPIEGRAIWPPGLLLDEDRMDSICNSYGGAY